MKLLKVYSIIIFFSVVFFLYLSELYLFYNVPKGNPQIENLKNNAKKYKNSGNDFDIRTKFSYMNSSKRKMRKFSTKNYLNFNIFLKQTLIGISTLFVKVEGLKPIKIIKYF